MSQHRLPLLMSAVLAVLGLLGASAARSATTKSTPVHIPNRPSHALFQGTQTRQHTEISYNPSTQTVTVTMLVQDPQGFFIPNIRRENFALYENGKRQRNATVQIERSPVTLGILLEYGGRYRQLTQAVGQEVATAAAQFLDEIGRQDRIAIWRYGNGVQALSQFSDAHDVPPQVIADLGTPPVSETNLYDALIQTLGQVQPLSGRKALLLISSGLDTFSQHTFDEALKAARSSDVPIYVVNLGPQLQHDLVLVSDAAPYAAIDWSRAGRDLGEFASVSGGRLYTPQSPTELPGLYDDLMENLRARYVITYRSSTSTLGPRTVRVELVDAHTGGPLKIIDADGREVRAHITVEGRYLPVSSPVAWSKAGRRPGRATRCGHSGAANHVGNPGFLAPA